MQDETNGDGREIAARFKKNPLEAIQEETSRETAEDIDHIEAGKDGEAEGKLQRMHRLYVEDRVAKAKPRAAADAGSERMPNDVRTIRASDLQPEAVDWLWEGKIPRGSLTLLAGEPGLGKSLLTCSIAADLSRGVLGGKPGSTLMITAEDSLRTTMRPRLEAAGADLDRIHFPEEVDGGAGLTTVTLQDDVDRLREMTRSQEVEFVVIDPLMAYLPSSVNSWQDQSVRRALTPLYRLAEDERIAFLLVLHLNKRQDSNPLQRIGGSVGVPAAARSVLLLARDPDDPHGDQGGRRVLAHVKSNLAPLASSLSYEIEGLVMGDEDEVPTARLVHLGETHYGAADLLVAPERESAPALGEAIGFLEQELADGRKPASLVRARAEEARISEQTLKRAKQRLGVKSEKGEGAFDSGWFWSLPEPADDPNPDDGAA